MAASAFCSDCGVELFADAKFCAACGMAVDPPAPEVAGEANYEAVIARDQRQGTMYVGIASAAIVVFGAFMPWVSAGIFSKSGIEGDGAFTLIMAIVAGTILFTWGRRSAGGTKRVVVAGLLGAATLATGIFDGYDIASLEQNELLRIEVGMGIYTTVIGAAGLTGAAFYALSASA